MTNELAEIPDYTLEDFTESAAPYEYLYSFSNNPFLLEQMTERMKQRAAAVGLRTFVKLWKTYLKSLTDKNISPENVTDFEGLPLKQQLQSGKYICNADGVSVPDSFGIVKEVCPHMIAPIKRFKNIDTGEELLEIWFQKGGTNETVRSETITVSKDKISNSITELAKYGVVVHQQNARALSAYLLDMEQYNYDTLQEVHSVTRLGWVRDDVFSPYVDSVYFDGEEDFGSMFGAVKQSGDFDVWKEAVKSVRAEKTAARYYIAASFASAILKPCGLLPFLVHTWGGSENGKAQPLDTKIITPNGYKLMGEIHIGDKVIGGDGKPHSVIGVYPQGIKDVYKLTFSDGTFTRCCKEHLWNVTTRTRRNHNRGYITMSLEEMMKKPFVDKKGYQYRIPVSDPVEYSKKNTSLPIDPYALGALIGDGCLTLRRNPANRSTHIYFSNTEPDVVERLNHCLKKHDVYFMRNPHTGCQYVLSGSGIKQFKRSILELGLNTKSINRFIPQQYLYASVEDRKELLSGLMDTDGFVGHTAHANRYSTKSEPLAKDIQQLCWSLGYRATISENSREEYTVHIITDDVVFHSEKHLSHKDSVVRTRQEDKRSIAIVSVELCGREECQCIMLDSADHTYLCDDFIVTHNTVALMLAASVWANPELGEFVTTYNGTRYAQETTAGFLNSLPLCLDELQIQAAQGVKDFDDIIYQLCEGVSKKQGKAAGGLRKQQKWRNVILSNGEHTILKPLSGGGARNRVIEIEAPGLIYSDLVGLCEIITKNYGFAGKMFVDWLCSEENLARVRALQKECYQQLKNTGATDKQVGSASAILTADKIVTEIIFRDDMALTVEDMVPVLLKKEDIDINNNTLKWLYDFVAANSIHFSEDSRTEIWGKVIESEDDPDEDTICFIRSIFDREMKANGLDSKSFLSWAARNGILRHELGRFDKQMRIPGTKGKPRCVCLRITGDTENAEISTFSATEELPF